MTLSVSGSPSIGRRSERAAAPPVRAAVDHDEIRVAHHRDAPPVGDAAAALTATGKCNLASSTSVASSRGRRLAPRPPCPPSLPETLASSPSSRDGAPPGPLSPSPRSTGRNSVRPGSRTRARSESTWTRRRPPRPSRVSRTNAVEHLATVPTNRADALLRHGDEHHAVVRSRTRHRDRISITRARRRPFRVAPRGTVRIGV